MPDKYLKAPVYEKYLKDRHHESYKMNPFSNVIADIVRKKIFKDEAEVDFRIPFIRVGFDGKTMKGVMIAESEDTSIDGT